MFNFYDREFNREDGFSLVELVVAVGLMFILSVSSGIAMFNNVLKDQKEDTIEAVVNSVYAEALANERGFDDRYTVETAIDNRRDELVELGAVVSGGTVNFEDSVSCVWVKAVGEDGFSYSVDSRSNGCETG